MSRLRELKASRAGIKGQVIRIGNFLTSKEGLTYKQAQSRVEKLKEFWIAFETTQTALEVSLIEADDKIEEIVQLEQVEREIFENSYYKALDKAYEIMAETAVIPARQDIEANIQPGNIDIKLPMLKLPVFGGEYDQWMLFKDAFESLINGNRKLSAVQKFQYLRSTLKDEALHIISGLNTSAENYRIAWNLLVTHYGNKKLIINSHLSKLLEFPAISKENHATLRQFVTHICTHLAALQVLGQPTDQWDTLIIFLARNKLPYYTQRAWEEEAMQQERNFLHS